jgi:DMSO/TMAO reductase YedYZ molybdopterin-dependent catalytic subunit
MTSPSPRSSHGALNRRSFLAGAAALPFALHAAALSRQGQSPAAEGMIERMKEPQNLEFPFHTLDSFIVPNERFYVRNHFPLPRLEAKTWRLRVEGAVTQALELTYEQLRGLPTRTVTVTLECAGNGRLLNVPPLKGVGWAQGAVGNAEWTGVPLAAVLERAGLKNNAVEVILEGADRGEVTAEPKPHGPLAFARSLPLTKARQSEVLLAFQMNGTDLPPAHGFPVRAIVPGWYGMASVKWLTRLVVTDTPFQGFWQTTDYSYYDRNQGFPVLRPLTEMQVKSLIARPRAGETVKAGTQQRVHGAAWTGDADISRVEISTDGGRSWADAKLLGQPQRFAWRLWEYTWQVPSNAGRVTLMSRATDSRGRTQPATRNPDFRNYMVCHVLPVEVQVS